MSSVPPQGLLGSAFGLAFAKPHLLGDLNRIMGGGRPQMETLRDAMFHETIELERLRRYYHLCQPESHRAIWDMSPVRPAVPVAHAAAADAGAGGRARRADPADQVRMTARSYGVSATILPDLGHGMMMETDWRIAADPILYWLKSQGL